MRLEKYTHKPFDVEAIQVSVDNFSEVAAWCDGTIIETDDDRYIKVKVKHPLNVRQTQARVDDWILNARGNFKVYTPSAFERSFVASKSPEATVNIFTDSEELRSVDEVAAGDAIQGKL